MPTRTHSTGGSSRNKAANVNVDNDLLEKARHHGINLSRALEDRLTELIREKETSNWLRENRAAIEAHNRHIDAAGAFSEGLRTF